MDMGLKGIVLHIDLRMNLEVIHINCVKKHHETQKNGPRTIKYVKKCELCTQA